MQMSFVNDQETPQFVIFQNSWLIGLATDIIRHDHILQCSFSALPENYGEDLLSAEELIAQETISSFSADLI